MISSNKALKYPKSQGPLLRFIGNNDPPTTEEYELASQILQDINQELNELEDEIMELQKQVSKMQARRKGLKARRDKQIAPILSPWRKLPPEILANILQAAVNPDRPSSHFTSSLLTDRQIFIIRNIRAVCKMWREVALATHALWTSVWIDFDAYSPRRMVCGIDSVQEHFERAGPTLPLRLGFGWRRGEPIIDAWLEYLFSRRSRLTEITFKTTTSGFRQFEDKLKTFNGEKWKTLFLRIELDSSGGSTTDDVSEIIEASFPKLQTLEMWSEDEQAPTLGLFAGHSKLLNLDLSLGELNPDLYFPKLAGFPSLVNLSLTVNPFLPLSNDTPSCHFPRLQSLTIWNTCSFTILSKIQAPSLSSLQIVPPLFNSDGPNALIDGVQVGLMSTFPLLVNFLKEGSKIHDFYLKCWFMEDNGTLYRLLESLPTVRRLCLDTWFTDDSQSADDNQVQVLDTEALLPNVDKICLHSRGTDGYPCNRYRKDSGNPPFLPNPSYWRSFLAFLSTRNSSSGSDNARDSGLTTEGSNCSEDIASRPNLLVCLPDMDREMDEVGGVDELSTIIQSIRELDGVSIAPNYACLLHRCLT